MQVVRVPEDLLTGETVDTLVEGARLRVMREPRNDWVHLEITMHASFSAPTSGSVSFAISRRG